MMRCIVLLAVVLASLSCSKDRPVPVAPAGKSSASLAAPPEPTNLRFDAPTDSSCTVRWDASAGATDYDVSYKPTSGGRWTNEPHAGDGLYNTIRDLEPNTAYHWAVRAENSDGASEWVFGPNFTTRPSEGDDSSDVPAAPTNLRFDAPTDSSCTVRWDASAGATDYDVSYKPASGGRWTNEPHAGDGLYNTIHDLEPGTAYRWAVRAENSDGASAWAFGPNFTTLRNQAESGEGTAQPEGPSQDGERAALVALYHATGGDNWTINHKWLSDAPISEWYGVHGRRGWVQGVQYEVPSPIIELSLHSNNLRGTIPPELGQLVHLEKLYLGRNRLSGSIPPELGKLVNLQFLELHNNQLSGSVPPELGRLTNLKHLWLGYNRLSGTIPTELGNLTNLWVANIIGNQFTGCLPAAWREVSPGLGVDPYSLPFCGSRSSGAFDIELVYVHPRALTVAQKALVRQAADRWEEVIVGDLPNVNFASNPINEWIGSPLNATIRVNDVVDDVRIFVGVQPMDEEVWGAGTPLRIRFPSYLPSVAAFVLNPDVLEGWMPDDDLYALILHEMGHCLGFGTIWDDLGLLKNSSVYNPSADTYFFGFQARQAFDQFGGRAYRGRKVPVEQDGSGHWRWSVFGDELMIGRWVWPYATPLSRITVASMADIGYEVNFNAADAYRVPSTAAAKPVADETRPGCQIFRYPIHVADEEGRVVDILDP